MSVITCPLIVVDVCALNNRFIPTFGGIELFLHKKYNFFSKSESSTPSNTGSLPPHLFWAVDARPGRDNWEKLTKTLGDPSRLRKKGGQVDTTAHGASLNARGAYKWKSTNETEDLKQISLNEDKKTINIRAGAKETNHAH